MFNCLAKLRSAAGGLLLLAGGLLLLSCGAGQNGEVVIYTAHDRLFSEPILETFITQTGVTARPKYDTEATKTIGLVNTIRAERDRPRADVFWNNEIMNAIRLKNQGLLQPLQLESTPDIPAAFRDPEGYWIGFAARARIIIVNNDLVPEGEEPRSIFDLTRPEWKGKVGIAKPLLGTTSTHVSVLFAMLGNEGATKFLTDLKANEVAIESGNRVVARKVAAGQLAVGLTDTDDAFVEIQDGSPVRIVFPDCEADGMGTLLIPNTLMLIKGAPHPEAGRVLIEHLLSPAVEEALARSRAAQIPLNPEVSERPPLEGLDEVKFMDADFVLAAEKFDTAMRVVEQHFLK